MRACLLAFSSALILSTSATAQEIVPVSGSFDSVRADGAFEVIIHNGADWGVTYEGDTPLEEYEITLRDDLLRIEHEGKRSGILGLFTRRSNPDGVFEITTPSLANLSGSRSVDITADDVSAEDVSISGNTSASITIASISAGQLRLSANTSADLRLSGSCQDAEIRANTSADVSITAVQSFEGQANTSADIDVYGNPEVRNSATNTSGSIRFRD